MKHFDVAVIGAGVVGGLIARELSRYNLNICILEAQNDVAMGATRANSGIVHAGFDAEVGSFKARFNVAGSKMMKRVTDELGVKYKNNGSLVVGFSDADRKHIEKLVERGIENGVEGVRLIEVDELRAIEPNISDSAICALYAPTGAIVCPYELCIASIGNAMDNGASLKCDFKVEKIEKSDEKYVIYSENEHISADFVVNAAGIYADEIAKMVGDESFTVRARKGDYILLDRECGTMANCTIFRCPNEMGKGILVSPTVDGNLLLGPTSVNIDDKGDKSTYADGLSKIMATASENLRVGLPFGKSITSFCGLRAYGNTGDFIIRPACERFINVAGIESPGLSSAPAIAIYVAELLESEGLRLEKKEDFNPIREPKHAFREGSIAEKNEYIRRDASYGRIICRCESISEGEILDAIRSNPPARDLDGVKRRCRAGMGRCQGGFCAPYVMELIARENGVDFASVTKCGGDSAIVFSKTKGAQV